jgi:hypothetical protein
MAPSALPPEGSRLLPAGGFANSVVITTGGGTGLETAIVAEPFDRACARRRDPHLVVAARTEEDP